MKRVRPGEMLLLAIRYAAVMDCLPRRPGAVIERLNAAEREALKQLTSDDPQVRAPRVHGLL